MFKTTMLAIVAVLALQSQDSLARHITEEQAIRAFLGLQFRIDALEAELDTELFITKIFVDFDGTCSGFPEIAITGENFDNGDPPDVTIGIFPVPLTVCFAAATLIVAELPANFPDGDYRVTVETGPSATGHDAYDLTIGAVGPAGDPTALIAGPGLLFNPSRTELSVDFGNLTTASGIVIESTANGVQLIAGGSKITLSASGDVTIESADALALKSATRLDLNAPVIDIQATSGLTLKGLTVDVDGAVKTTVKAPLTEVRGSAILDMRGALIKLN